MIVFLIDADNLSDPAWVQEAFQVLEKTEGAVSIRRAYGSAENLKGLTEPMRAWAIRPFVNLSLSKNTTDVSLAIDAMELACQTPRPTLIAIGSGDADFAPLVVRLRERGVRVLCVTKRGKLAQDAVPAYDQVIYVGGDQDAPTTKALQTANAKLANQAVPKKSTNKMSAVNAAPAKKKAAKKSASNAGKTTVDMATVADIVAAVPKLQTGEWQHLAEVVSVLRDKKLLSKNIMNTHNQL